MERIKNRLKKSVAAVAAVCAVLALALGGTLAYFSTEEKVDNVVSTGGIDIELIEYTLDEQGERIAYPEQPIEGFMPGQTVSKIPVARASEASASSWVRAKVEVVATDSMSEAVDPSAIEISFNNTGWTYVAADGYWYCNELLLPGAETQALFESVTFKPASGNEYQSGSFDVKVSFQAVQSINNGTSATEALGWPAE